MTREELERMFQFNMTDAFIEWDKAVNAEYKEENEETFYQGAYAAQKYLIEKVCKRLQNNIDFYVETNYGEDFTVDIERLLKDIRKTMEE